MKTFATFEAALAWAKTFAREHVHSFQAWRVERRPTREFAIAVYSRNTGARAGFIAS